MQLKLRRREILKGLQAVCEPCKMNFIHFFVFKYELVIDNPDNIPTVTKMFSQVLSIFPNITRMINELCLSKKVYVW